MKPVCLADFWAVAHACVETMSKEPHLSSIDIFFYKFNRPFLNIDYSIVATFFSELNPLKSCHF